MDFTTSRIPFAERRGLPVWPNGKRMAVLVYTAPEQWHWEEKETISPLGTFAAGRGAPPSLSTRTAVAYGFNVGLPRLAEIYAEFGMKVTLWTSGVAVEQYPDVLAALVTAGHELGAHGYTQGSVMASLTRDEQQDSIRRSLESLAKLSGSTPRGWISPGAEANEDTVELLAAAGLDYHGDLQDDELPYFLHIGDRTMVEIPYRLAGNLNDLSVMTRNVNSVRTAVSFLTEAFDAYHQAAQDRPLLFNYGTHPYVSGRPDNAAVMRGVLEHIHSHDDVWITNYGEIARWWRQSFESSIVPGTGRIDVSNRR